jgi:branched-chain amino acid transport system permease protein
MRLPEIRSFGPTVWGIGLFLILLAGLAPRIPVFLLTLVIGLLIWATLAYSLNLITGLTGYVSFGHVVFMAFGGYALAFGVGTLNWPPVAGVALGAGVGVALALGIGVVTLRFRGVYFAIATLVVAIAALYIVLEVKELGDGQGLYLNVGFEPLSMFYTIWVILAIEIGLTYSITHGRIGYGLRSIKSDEDAANTLGINAARLKLFVYTLSGLFAGAAGGVYAWNVSGAFPYQAFDLGFSLQMLAMIVIGGMGTLLGPLIGTVAVYLPSQVFLTIPVLSGLQAIVIGIVVVVIALFVPGGIVGTLHKYIPEFRGILE